MGWLTSLLALSVYDYVPELKDVDNFNDTASFLDKFYYDNTVLNWLVFLGIILGAIVVAKLFYWFSKTVIKKLTAKTKTKLDDILVDMLEEPVVLGIVTAGLWYGYSHWLAFPHYEGVDPFAYGTLHVMMAITVTWLISRTMDAIVVEYIVPLTEKSESDLDDQFMPILRKGMRTIIWVMGIMIALNNAGYNITALIAGLGVGGLALALAAQDTVKNVFGGIMIFVDKPFKLKDRIVISGYDGSVTEIGIRSTRMRTLQGRLVTIPNSVVSNNIIENISEEPTRKIVMNFGLTYDMSAEQIEEAMRLLRGIGEAHESIEEDMSIGFNAFGDFSLGVIFVYYISKGGDILQTQTDVNLQVLTQFNAAKLDMAFPTQTIHHQPA
jgi:MscS family membrane protein